MRFGASVVWHHLFLLVNSLNKTEAALFFCRLCFLRAFYLISLFTCHVLTNFVSVALAILKGLH